MDWSDADGEEDEVASDTEPESSVNNNSKSTKGFKVKYSKESRKIPGWLPRNSIIKNKSIGRINFVPEQLQKCTTGKISVNLREVIYGI